MTAAPLVGIIMGSDSDLPVMRAAAEILEEFKVDYELAVMSAHRTPARVEQFAQTAAERGMRVIIAGAGGAAHLAGVVAAFTALPVIGVPILTKTLGGADSLYSMVQMPAGIPVATVAINGAKNAGLLAVQILATADETLRAQMLSYKEKMRQQVEAKAENLANVGWKQYLTAKGYQE
ncbi:MAG: 5-(carboxyamino)imidazole ribonucleotide mutase [Firmicutes bacterium]|jgi:5-(carboxyamino)imidazole ribonucleotide mutase|nr:5-(carboxyamino)imidazole ribonucleotide mutase [Bacillota bacterium]NLZ92539.1 5-(carboxyamino)imidazole ribonucleotide mutase [Bacillota bacterium]